MSHFVRNPRATKIKHLNVSLPMNGEDSSRDSEYNEELDERSDSFSSPSLPRSAVSTHAGLSLAITKCT